MSREKEGQVYFIETEDGRFVKIEIESMEVNCPACTEKRLHTAEDWVYHPLAGHGWNGHAWTHPDLNPGAAASLGQISGEVVQTEVAPVSEYGDGSV